MKKGPVPFPSSSQGFAGGNESHYGMHMKKILITGGCGFIGSNLALALRHDGKSVVCFDNLSRRGSELLCKRVQANGCRFIKGDIRRKQDLAALKGKYDLMIECSAEPSVLAGSKGADAWFMVENNLIGSLNCFEFCRERQIPIIFLSTSRVYPYDAINRCLYRELPTRYELGRAMKGISKKGVGINFPLGGYRSLYGATKFASEHILREYSYQYDLPAIINRCGVIAGPWQLGKVDQGVFTYWMASHYYKRALRYIGFGGKGKQVRDLLHIDDLISLVRKQMRRIGDYRGEVFNAGGGRFSNLSLLETTKLCQEITGNKVPIGREPGNRPADVIWFITGSDPTEKEFNWKPKKGAKETLADIYSWIRVHHKEFKSILIG